MWKLCALKDMLGWEWRLFTTQGKKVTNLSVNSLKSPVLERETELAQSPRYKSVNLLVSEAKTTHIAFLFYSVYFLPQYSCCLFSHNCVYYREEAIMEPIHFMSNKWLIKCWTVVWRQWESNKGMLKLGFYVIFLYLVKKTSQILQLSFKLSILKWRAKQEYSRTWRRLAVIKLAANGDPNKTTNNWLQVFMTK